MPDESLLIKKAREGNVPAFEELIRNYQQMVYNIALRMCGNEDDASDIAQETLIKIFRSIRDFKGDSKFSTWIYRITTNVCLDYLRKNKKNAGRFINPEFETDDGSLEVEIKDPAPQPEEVAERKEVQRAVQEAIDKLSEDHRTVIVLRDINNLSYEEIAVILNCSEGTVKSRINRARSALRDILSKNKELFTPV